MSNDLLSFPPALSLDDQAADWLLRLEQAADPAVAADCTVWCAADPAHQAAFDRARRVWDLCRHLPAAQSSQAPAPIRHPVRPARRTGRRPWLAAACVALLVLAGSVWGPGLTGGPRTGTAEWSQADLTDGSHILLAPQTALSSDLKGDSRRVTLDHGDAFFTVSPDPARPFRVIAGPLTVTVTGTRFAVSRRGSAVSVQVEEGRVLASLSNRPDTPVPLTAGEAVRLEDPANALTPYTLPVDAIAPWRSGILAVENRPVAEVIDDLRPYLPGMVILTDSALGQQRVTGVYSLHTPQAALRAVVAPFRGQVQALGPLATLISGPEAGPAKPR